MTDTLIDWDEQTHTQKVETMLREFRGEANSMLSLADKCGALMEKIPSEALGGCAIVNGHLMVYGTSRDTALAVIRALSAGKWEKQLCYGHSHKIDYTATIDGVTVQIYATQAPPSCRIVEETEEVPAHTVTKRRLVCTEAKASGATV